MNADTLKWLQFGITIAVFAGGIAGLWAKVSVQLALIKQDVASIKEKLTEGVDQDGCALAQERCPARREFITNVSAVRDAK